LQCRNELEKKRCGRLSLRDHLVAVGEGVEEEVAVDSDTANVEAAVVGTL
jgi:hypothetical protein